MTYIYSNHSMRYRRKELRNNATPQEVTLWKYLKGSNFGYKFRRQQSIGPYVVDFYCAEKRLIIELDGKHHSESETAEYDLLRTEYLQHLNHNVVRFWNEDIDNSLPDVLIKIRSILFS
jgi:very-short-patch-repair endonuclease